MFVQVHSQTGTMAQQHSAVLAEYARTSWLCFLHVRIYLRARPFICRPYMCNAEQHSLGFALCCAHHMMNWLLISEN